MQWPPASVSTAAVTSTMTPMRIQTSVATTSVGCAAEASAMARVDPVQPHSHYVSPDGKLSLMIEVNNIWFGTTRNKPSLPLIITDDRIHLRLRIGETGT